MKSPRRARLLILLGPTIPLALGLATLPPTTGDPAPQSQDGHSASQPPQGGTAPLAPASAPSDEAFHPFSSGIVGSKHDFSDSGRVPRDLCLPCHTPHITAAQAPLRGGQRTTTQPAPTALGYQVSLSPASLLCLSCHDGIIAPDVYGGSHAMVWSDRDGGALGQSAGGIQPGLMRLTSHPVGIAYPDNDPKYHPATAVSIDGRVHLPAGRIQCTSCHDPHNTERHNRLLVKSNARSALCLTCHKL